MNRNKTLLDIRKPTNTIANVPSGDIEKFQNDVLRPILKFQHEGLKLLFAAFLRQKGETFDWGTHYDKEKIHHLIHEKAFKDRGFVNVIHGMVMGLMTTEELTFYTQHIAEIRRRVTTMCKERIQRIFNETV